jgi:hypothetical protein
VRVGVEVVTLMNPALLTAAIFIAIAVAAMTYALAMGAL